jgi:hypothetical protein
VTRLPGDRAAALPGGSAAYDLRVHIARLGELTKEAAERGDWHAVEVGARDIQALENRLWHATHASPGGRRTARG